MNKIESIKDKFSYFLKPLENLLESEAKSLNIPFYLIKGKRLRAIISHISGLAFDQPLENTVMSGYALEMIHAASLIHDDIVDDSETRRGGETLSKILTTRLSVLIGDLIFTKALVKVMGFPKFYSSLAVTVYKMALGQYEEDVLSSDIYDEHIYLDIIYKKTASLYEIAFESGLLLRNEENIFLRESGKMFGMAFQILDDCDDYYEDEGKFNLPRIYEKMGHDDPIGIAKVKAKFYLEGSEWNLRRYGIFKYFSDIFDYMWARV